MSTNKDPQQKKAPVIRINQKVLHNNYCGWLIKTKINEAINYFRDEASGYL